MHIGAAIVAIVAAISLTAQWWVSAELLSGAGPAAVAWRMLGYFTVLGNLATLIIMLRVAISRKIRARRAAAITVVMAITGLGYHGLLAGIWAHQGLAWWADQGLHTAVPVLTILWWVAYAPKSGLKWYDAVRWLIWPILYADYALVRGLASGFYPYPFLDVSVLGIAQIALNVVVLAAAFVALGVLLIGTARIIR